MASLTGSTIAESYEQLLSLPDGGLNGNNLVAITDGDSSTAIGMKVATNKIEIIPGSNDANAFEVSQADGTAVLTVNTSTVGATLIGALTVGVDDAGHDVIFYGDTASSNMTWDTSADDLILNDSTLHIDQDDNANSILIDSESTSANILDIQAGALQTGNGMRIFSDSSHGGSRNLLLVINDDASATGTTGIMVQQNAAAVGLKLDQNTDSTALLIDSESTTANVLNLASATTTTGNIINLNACDALTDGRAIYVDSNSPNANARSLINIINNNVAATGAIPLKIQQDATTAAAIRADGGKIEFINTSLSTTASFLGITNQISKTAGSTNASDDYWGMYNELQFSDADAGFGHLRGIYNEVKVDAADGTEATTILGIESQVVIGDGDVNNVFGNYNKVDINAGTVDAEIYATWNEIELSSGVSNVVNAFGGAFLVDCDTDPSSRASVLWLDAYTNCDFSLQGYNRPDDTLSWQVTYTGVQTNEGAINASTGLDYAEYFESKDGKAIAIGKTVKLDGDKIVTCEDGDTPIGVVRPANTSAAVGGGQVFHWQEKFAKDDYGATVWESYTLKKWSEEITEEEYHKRGKDETGGVEGGKVTDTKVTGSEAVLYDGDDLETSPIYYKENDELPEGKSVGDVKEEASKKVGDVKTAAVADTYVREHKYHSDKLPEGVTAPEDAKTITPGNKRQKVNSNYDPSKAKEYKSREEREEWHIIGLLGQIQITKGQPIAASWIKMKDISDTVEMYFVK